MRSSSLIPLRVLFFRSSREDYLAFNTWHFAIGLFITWLVGMGRYWDNPRVGFLQHLGVGSVVYVFVLSALLWAIVWPFRSKEWSYGRVVTLVVLTAPPAALYAIPIEQWMSVRSASQLNLLIVLIVSAWRMTIWSRFLIGMSAPGTPVVTLVLLPVVAIIAVLSYLNLEHAVVWQFMGGNREEPTPADATYNVIGFIATLCGYFVLPFLLFSYAWNFDLLRKAEKNPSPLQLSRHAGTDNDDAGS